MSSPRTIIQLTRAFIHDSRLRRTLLFYLTLAAVLMVFLGALLISPPPHGSLLVFVAYWLACGWLTLTVLLLAVFDLLAVRSAGRKARRRLENDLLSRDDDPHAS